MSIAKAGPSSMKEFELCLASLPACSVCADTGKVHTHGGERDIPPSKYDIALCPKCGGTESDQEKMRRS